MNIKLTDGGISLTPENQAEFFQLEILWNNRQNFRMIRNADPAVGELISMDIHVSTYDKDRKQEVQQS